MISRGFVVVAVASLAVAGVAAAAISAEGQGEAKRKAAIELWLNDPVVVHGTGFAAEEKLTLRVMVGGDTYTKRFRASDAGKFTKRFADAAVDNCDALSIVAVGAEGSRATITRKFQIPPACGISPQPGVPPAQP